MNARENAKELKTYSILIVHNYYQHTGGEDIVVENERQMLEMNGHSVFTYTRNNEEIASLKSKILFLFNFFYSRRSYKEIKSLILEKKVDIIHVHNTFPLITSAVYMAAYDMGIPVIQTLHNFRLVCPEAMFLKRGKVCEECVKYGLIQSVKWGCYRNSRFQTAVAAMSLWVNRKMKVYNKIDAFIALTEFNKEKFESSFPPCRNKIFVKPNFISAKKEINFQVTDDNKKNYLYVGRLSEEKGLDLLTDAFIKLPNCKLEIIGTGDREEQIKEKLRKNAANNICMSGYLPHEEVLKKMVDVKAVIIPSQCYEGFPMGIIESFSVGTMVITGNLGNPQEIVHDRYNGLIFQYNSVDSLVKTVTMLENDEIDIMTLSRNARETYLINYNEEINYSILMSIYDRVYKIN